MILWRLSGRRHANAFDGGYGLLHDGRWNTAGHAVTYCATSPSLCVLEKLVHIEVLDLLPPLVMVRYDVPDRLAFETLSLDDLPQYWRLEENWTQRRGDLWHETLAAPLFRVPSAVVPLAGSPDVNVLINHRHQAVANITIAGAEPFLLDARLL
jgi:RES domain-containing protein